MRVLVVRKSYSFIQERNKDQNNLLIRQKGYQSSHRQVGSVDVFPRMGQLSKAWLKVSSTAILYLFPRCAVKIKLSRKSVI